MQAGLLFAWHDHQTPETKATAAQQATADTGLIVIESTSTVSYCLSTSLAKVMAEKHTVCFIIYHVYREVDSSGTSCDKSELCLLSQWAPIILRYIKKLTSTWSSVMALHAYRKENIDK